MSGIFLSLTVLVHDADTTVQAVPAEIAAARSALTAEIQSTRRQLLATVNTQATAIRKTSRSGSHAERPARVLCCSWWVTPSETSRVKPDRLTVALHCVYNRFTNQLVGI